ncbi:hypothetical protein IC229_05645 [Spirosoma sp. BT702]|uniref:Uncharacterized protein n=1 Tax=Spirosoma profusum TaxID=2771354 RepID=A0A927AQC3_9BACT|nr:hypothetical protein [Spirosoma profusum]MBD2700108.1 hypothetical protein [Spirosoma profusum]
MKYIVLKGSETFEKLLAIRKRIDQSDAIARELVAEFGATEYLGGGSDYVAGNLQGLRLQQKPEGWKQVYANRHHNCFFPKSNKQNKPLLDRIAAIPKVSTSELNNCVGFKRQWVGLTRLNRIGAKWGDDFILVEISEEATYQPLADMEELTITEFKRLVAILKEGEKQEAHDTAAADLEVD